MILSFLKFWKVTIYNLFYWYSSFWLIFSNILILSSRALFHKTLKKLSDEEVAAKLRTASITCENDMLKVNVPSKAVDPEGWQIGQEERQRY